MQLESSIQLLLAVVLLVGQLSLGQFRQAPFQFLRPQQHRFSGRTRTRSAEVDDERPFVRLASGAKIQEATASQWLAREASARMLPSVQSKCHKRSLGRVIKSAKSLLTDGLEQYATRANLVLGSTLAAAAVPLVAMVLPVGGTGNGGARQKTATELGNESGVGAWARRLASSLAQTGVQGRVDSVMGWIERSVEHLPNFPRLHPQECVKRSICEAHLEPDKHGATGFILRILFPATNLAMSDGDGGEGLEYKVTNKYRHAAGYGLARRLEAQNNSSPASASLCREKYEDCVVSLLEVAQNLIDVFLQ